MQRQTLCFWILFIGFQPQAIAWRKELSTISGEMGMFVRFLEHFVVFIFA